jgi:hypothetical protein
MVGRGVGCPSLWEGKTKTQERRRRSVERRAGRGVKGIGSSYPRVRFRRYASESIAFRSRIEIQTMILHDLLCNHPEFRTELMFDAVPERDRTIGTSGGDQLEHDRAQV